MTLVASQIPIVANVPNGGVAVLTGTTIGTLGSDTNGITAYTAGVKGGRVTLLTGVTDDTVAVNVFVYIKRGATIIPLGLVNIPLSSGNTNSTRTNVDFLNGINIVGLPNDNGKPYIPLLPNDLLRCTTLANHTAAKTSWIKADGSDYQ